MTTSTPDEIVVQVDPETGAVIGEVSKRQAHQDGTCHATIHVWILDDEGRLLFQRRAPSKQTHPGLFDITAAGHIRPGEDGTREVEEELGATVRIDEMASIGILHIDQKTATSHNRERPRVYLWNAKRPMSSYVFEDGEVDALCAVSLEDVPLLLSGQKVSCLLYEKNVVTAATLSKEQLVPLGQEYWNTVIKKINELVNDDSTQKDH